MPVVGETSLAGFGRVDAMQADTVLTDFNGVAVDDAGLAGDLGEDLAGDDDQNHHENEPRQRKPRSHKLDQYSVLAIRNPLVPNRVLNLFEMRYAERTST